MHGIRVRPCNSTSVSFAWKAIQSLVDRDQGLHVGAGPELATAVPPRLMSHRAAMLDTRGPPGDIDKRRISETDSLRWGLWEKPLNNFRRRFCTATHAAGRCPSGNVFSSSFLMGSYTITSVRAVAAPWAPSGTGQPRTNHRKTSCCAHPEHGTGCVSGNPSRRWARSAATWV